MNLPRPALSAHYLAELTRVVKRELAQLKSGKVSQDNGVARIQDYAVSELPPAGDYSGGLVYVSNESGGAVLAFSDGTSWRRVTDRGVVS